MISLIFKTILFVVLSMGMYAFLAYHAVTVYMFLEYGFQPARKRKRKR